PISLVRDLAGPLGGTLANDAVVTDVTSTKARIVAAAEAGGLRFVGGHPMAGRETSGYDAATPELFRRSEEHTSELQSLTNPAPRALRSFPTRRSSDLPISLVRDLAGPLGGTLANDAVVTDVTSTKARIVAAAEAGGLRFVGGHPMAGRETSGYDAATPELFR